MHINQQGFIFPKLTHFLLQQMITVQPIGFLHDYALTTRQVPCKFGHIHVALYICREFNL